MTELRHPGEILRKDYLEPRGYTVTDAAKQLGITRQALNNLVNCRSLPSRDLEFRLASFLHLPVEQVQFWRASYELAKTRSTNALRRRARGDSFAPQTADIVSWASQIEARYLLPRLVRLLVGASTNASIYSRFPAHGEVQLGGFDGVVENPSGRVGYVPAGRSVWELSTEQNPQAKAQQDYEKRKGQSLEFNPGETTYVSLTARRWVNKQKSQWVDEKKRERFWADVIVYDASDLEQWLETAKDVSLWFATQIGLRPSGVRSLEDFWDEFRRVTEPEITPDFVLAGRAAEAAKLETWMKTGAPVIRVLADSIDEAVGFWAAVLAKPGPENEGLLARVVVASDGERVREMMTSSQALTFAWKLDDPSLLATVADRGHRVFVPLAKSAAANPTIDIELPRLDRREFIAAIKSVLPREAGEGDDPGRARLADMKREHEAFRLWSKSGPSLTVYRRLFAAHGISSQPEWAAPQQGLELLPVLLAGSWSETNEADRSALAKLANCEYDSISRTMALWRNRPDSPIRRIGDTWMLSAPLDSWSLLAGLLTDSILNRYVDVALTVLGEADPSLDLLPAERWLAEIRGEVCTYSSDLRTGFAESLVLMAVVGKAADWSSRVVRQLLGEGVGAPRWASICQLLPLLAEAAPDAFLDAVEAELRCAPSSVLMLFKSEDHPLGKVGRYLHLLWALEMLAWDGEKYLPRVSRVLARLARLAPPGKLAEAPLNSLCSIFCTWHRNTAASLSERLSCIDSLLEYEEDVAWRVLLELLPTNQMAVSANNREPRWREKPPVEAPLWGEIWKANRELTERALRAAGIRPDRLESLLLKVSSQWPSEYRQQFIEKVREFAGMSANKDQRMQMWHGIRGFLALHRSFAEADWAMVEADVLPFEELLELLAPKDFPDRYIWLFNSVHPNLPRPKGTGFQERNDESEEMQRSTVRQIFEDRGLPGIIELALSVDYPGPGIIGAGLAEVVLDSAAQWKVMDLTLGAETDKIRNVGLSFVNRIQCQQGSDWIEKVVGSVGFSQWPAMKAVDFCLSLPDQRSTWDIVETLSEDAQTSYWKRAHLFINPRTNTADAHYAMRRLIEADRAYYALQQAGSHPEIFATGTLIDVLDTVFRALLSAAEPPQDSMLSYYLQRILERLAEGGDVGEDVLAGFEWKFLPIFRFNYSPVTLHRRMQRDPLFFADVVRCVFPAEEDCQESVESEPVSEMETRRVRVAWQLLSGWYLPPGVREDMSVDGQEISDWFRRARSLCAERKRRAVGDIEIGKILARVNPGRDGVWPPLEVRSLIEQADSRELESGIHSGRINMRGVHARSPFEGGRPEREYVKQYRNWAKAVSARWTCTGALLRAIAETYESMATHHDVSTEALDARA